MHDLVEIESNLWRCRPQFVTSAAATKPIELFNVAECFLDVRSVQSAEYPRKGNLHLALLWYESVEMWADRHEM
jgi:hypothetical protein